MINEVGQSFHQLGLSKSVLWFANADCTFTKFISPKLQLDGLFGG